MSSAQQYADFGGVDSRSSPLAMPPNRGLRVRNWVPQRDGHLELRWGYSTITMSMVTVGPSYPFTGYTLFDGTAYVVFPQADGVHRLNIATGDVSILTVRGAPISFHRWGWAFSNNRMYGVNGQQTKMLDSTGTLRDIGIPDPNLSTGWAYLFSHTTVAIGAADDSGIPASNIGGNQPGYQFFAAIINKVTLDVSNRIAIGGRLAPTVASDFDIANLPDFSNVDSEWGILIGRTEDGAEEPYAIIDANANWIVVPSGQTSTTITQSQVDMTSLLPYRNQPPQAFADIKLVGDRLYAFLPNSPYIYYCESEADYEAAGNYQFVGNGPACWPLDNWELMPTGGKITCIGSDSQLLWVFSKNKMALLQDSAGIMTWQGEWDVGAAGLDAFTSSPYGPHWITGKKELANMGSSGPITISDEYERVLLSRIGDPYLYLTQIAYQRDPSRNIDRMVIRCFDENFVPFIVYHDYAIRDYVSIMGTRSPNGQGYDSAYSGPLASPYNIGVIFDQNQVSKVYAAAVNGCIYELDSSPVDGAGNLFTADWISLVNAGPNRPGLDGIEWCGDANVQWSLGKKLSMGVADFTPLTPSEAVPGSIDPRGTDSQYRVNVGDVELKHFYLRAQLTARDNQQLLDPEFLEGTLDWSGQGTVGNDGGGSYLELATSTGVSSLYAIETNFDGSTRYMPVIPGRRMALSFDAFSANPTACLFGVWFLDANKGLLLATNITAAGPVDQWNNHWGYATVPPGAVYAYAYFGIIAEATDCRFRNPVFRLMDDPLYSQAWNDPPHVPLETYGRLYMITPLTEPEIGHR